MLLPALLALVVNIQAPPQGLEKMIATLEAETAARRDAAQQAWVQHRDAFLLIPNKGSLKPLLAAAPEIQDPALDQLAAWLSSSRKGKSPTDAILILLSRVMDGGGADRLVSLMGQLPPERLPEALRMSVERGGRRAVETARTLLNSSDAALRQAAYESLMLHAPTADLSALVSVVPLTGMKLDSVADMVDGLAERRLPPDLRLPLAFLQTRDVPLKMAVVRFLVAHPQNDAEDFLADRAVATGLSTASRTEALSAFVAGAEQYRWRDGEKVLSTYVKRSPRSSATEQVAWALWRLEDKSAKKYLLEELEDSFRAAPDDKRIELALAKRQVSLGDFPDAYRHFKKVVDSIDDGVYSLRMDPIDWVYAARSAAGARHSREAGEWLEMSSWSPVKLAPFKDLPEFSAYLDKQPFKRLFGQ